ncbi:MAG: hypothetical protein ABGY24_17585, partial [bacterium]
MQGSPEVMYIGEETPMEQYINIHDVLQGQRDVCKANAMRAKDVKDATDAAASKAPPRVMLAGATDSGKST